MPLFTDVFPEGVSGAGTTLIVSLETAPSFTAPSLALINVVGSVNVTPYFAGTAPFAPAHSQGVVDDTRMSDEIARQALGRSVFTIDNLEYFYDPQLGDVAGNKAYHVFEPGTTKYLLDRRGFPDEQALATTQIVDIWQIVYGTRHKVTPTGEDSKHKVQQTATITKVAEDVAIVA